MRSVSAATAGAATLLLQYIVGWTNERERHRHVAGENNQRVLFSHIQSSPVDERRAYTEDDHCRPESRKLDLKCIGSRIHIPVLSELVISLVTKRSRQSLSQSTGVGLRLSWVCALHQPQEFRINRTRESELIKREGELF